MKKYTRETKGFITLNNKVIVTDPCYGLDVWCQGVIENVLPGEYKCLVGFVDEGKWGIRVADIQVIHKDYIGQVRYMYKEDFEVGVDSGQAGIFDYEYYAKFHSHQDEKRHKDENWYNRVCNLTYILKSNPNYEEFDFSKYKRDDFNKLMHDLDEYEHSDKCKLYFARFDGNIIDDSGFVSCSGYGDGSYTCFTEKNKDGKVVSISVEYIPEDDDEDNEEEF